jgi:hypothetical protein
MAADASMKVQSDDYEDRFAAPEFDGSDEYVGAVQRNARWQCDELAMLLGDDRPPEQGGRACGSSASGSDGEPDEAEAPLCPGLRVCDLRVLRELGKAASAMEGLSKAGVRRAAATLLAPACLALLDLRLPLPRPAGGNGGDTGPRLELQLVLPRGYPELEPPQVTLVSDEAGCPPDAVMSAAAAAAESAVCALWQAMGGEPCLGELLAWAAGALPPLLWDSEVTWPPPQLEPEPEPAPEPEPKLRKTPDTALRHTSSFTAAFTAASAAFLATFDKGNVGAAKLSEADCALLVGRFVTAGNSADFGPHLAFGARKLAWVLTAKELHGLQGLTAVAVARKLAFGRVQEQAVLTGTQQMRVYLLPSADAVLCEWDPFIDLVGLHYGPEILELLDVHRVALKQMAFAEIQREDPALDMAALDTAYGDPRRSSPGVYLASRNRLVDARAFLCHELGLNEHADLPFTQQRTSANATKASMVSNVSLEGLDYVDVSY